MSFWKSPTWGSTRFSSSSCLTLASSCLTQDKVDSKIKKKELTLYTQVLFGALSGNLWLDLFKLRSDYSFCYFRKKKQTLSPQKNNNRSHGNYKWFERLYNVKENQRNQQAVTLQTSAPCNPQNVSHLEDSNFFFSTYFVHFELLISVPHIRHFCNVDYNQNKLHLIKNRKKYISIIQLLSFPQ